MKFLSLEILWCLDNNRDDVPRSRLAALSNGKGESLVRIDVVNGLQGNRAIRLDLPGVARVDNLVAGESPVGGSCASHDPLGGGDAVDRGEGGGGEILVSESEGAVLVRCQNPMFVVRTGLEDELKLFATKVGGKPCHLLVGVRLDGVGSIGKHV